MVLALRNQVLWYSKLDHDYQTANLLLSVRDPDIASAVERTEI
jgi:hypothetical protein